MPASRKPYIDAGALALAAALLAGCGARPEAILVLEPSVVSACDLPAKTRVRWDVSALGLKQARVEVNNLARTPKLWVSGGARDVQEAGAWAWDGYTVTLKSMNGVVLARRTLTSTPCPGMAWF